MKFILAKRIIYILHHGLSSKDRGLSRGHSFEGPAGPFAGAGWFDQSATGNKNFLTGFFVTTQMLCQ
jgi:hypothetical protein